MTAKPPGIILPFLLIQDEARHSRDEVYQYLKEHQIQAKKYFYPALHRQKVYREIGNALSGKAAGDREGGDFWIGIADVFAYE